MMMKRFILLAGALLLFPQLAWAACSNTISVKDGAGATQTFCRGTDGGSNMISYFTLLDPGGTNTAAITASSALKVDGSAVTQPVSGTVTANIGTSGSLALDASVAGLSLAQASTTSGQKGILDLGAVTTAAPTYTTAQSSPLSLTTGGALRHDLTTIGGTAVDTNSGNKSAGTQRVIIATDQPNLTSALNIAGTVTANIGTSGSLALDASVAGLSLAQASTTSGQKGALVQGAVTTSAPTYTTAQTSPLSLDTAGNLRTSIAGSPFGSALPANGFPIGGKGSGNLTAPIVCDNYTPFSFSSTSSQKIIAKASSKQIYICSINIVVAGATNVALIEGTKVTNECDTSTAGMAGGTTAATGWNFAANGGLTLGSGFGVVARTANANFDVCLLASASNQTSGGISWTQF